MRQKSYLRWAVSLSFGIIGCLFFSAFLGILTPTEVHATAGLNEQINYQGRLLTNTGATVADGTYNVEFKIYQDGTGCVSSGTSPCGGTLKWTETRTGADKVTVKNGYFSVQLGSVTPFSTSVDWNQDTLWLSLNVGGTGSPSYDGEMLPFRRLSAIPYALNAKQLGGLDYTRFLQVGPSAVQVDSGSLSSVFINKTGSSNILQLQRSGVDTFTLSNIGALAMVNNTNSTTAMQVMTSGSSATVFNVDTSNQRVGIGGVATVSKFEVINGDAAIYNSGNNAKLILGDSTAGGQNGYLQWDSTNDYFRIETVGTNGLKIKDNYVSIGNLFPDSPLKVGNGSTVLLSVGTTGDTLVQTSTDSTSAFRVLKNDTTPLFSVDTSASKVQIGNSTADGTGALLVLDSKNTSGDPSGVEGAMYYNSKSQIFRCNEGSRGWTECLGVPKPNTRRWAYIVATGNSSSINNIGDSVSGATGNGNQAPTGGEPAMVKYLTAATIGTTATLAGVLNYLPSDNPVYQAYIQLSTTANTRIWSGLTDQSVGTQLGSANPAGNYAIFRYDTGAGDANYQCVTKNGTTQTVVDSGVPPSTPGHRMEVAIIGGSKVVFKIDRVVVCTITDTLPTNNGLLRYVEGALALANSAVAIQVAWIYIESDK